MMEDIFSTPNQPLSCLPDETNFASGGGTERKSPTCLIVEDDRTMRHLVANYLEEHDMRAVSASRRDEVIALLARCSPDLVILDLRLGQEDGLDLLREIRTQSDIPVIITTGHRRDEIDRVVGLELGADDYITKPFGLRELLARIRAVLRRRETGQAAAQRDGEKGRCKFGSWQLDRRGRRLTNLSGEPIMLTKGEYALLVAFLDAPQRPLTREQLLQATRVHEDVFDRSIDVQVYGFGASWRLIPPCHRSSRPSAASATSSRSRSSPPEGGTAAMIAGTPALPVSFGPAMNVAGRITTVATNPQHGIFRKHSRDKVSPPTLRGRTRCHSQMIFPPVARAQRAGGSTRLRLIRSGHCVRFTVQNSLSHRRRMTRRDGHCRR